MSALLRLGGGWGSFRNRTGFTEILIVALVAAAAIGVTLARKAYRGRQDIVAERRYRGTIRATLAEVEARIGLDYAGRQIRVIAVPAEGQSGGYWYVTHDGERRAGWVYEGGTRHVMGVAVDPRTGEMPSGLRSALAHELAHAIWMSRGNFDETAQHREMRRVGIWPGDGR